MTTSRTLKVDFNEAPTVPTKWEEVEEMLKARDLSLPPRSCKNGKPYTPKVPTDLSSKPPAIVAEVLQELTAYYDYLAGQATVAKIVAENVKVVLKYKQLVAREKLDSSLSQKAKDIKADLDLEVKKWREKYQAAKSEKDILQSLLDIAERNIKTVSRIVAIMEQEVISGARTHNIQRTGTKNVLARLKAKSGQS